MIFGITTLFYLSIAFKEGETHPLFSKLISTKKNLTILHFQVAQPFKLVAFKFGSVSHPWNPWNIWLRSLWSLYIFNFYSTLSRTVKIVKWALHKILKDKGSVPLHCQGLEGSGLVPSSWPGPAFKVPADELRLGDLRHKTASLVDHLS